MNKEITIQIILYEENIDLSYKCLKNFYVDLLFTNKKIYSKKNLISKYN